MDDIKPQGGSSRGRRVAATSVKATEFFALKQQNPIAHLSTLRGNQNSSNLLTEDYLSPTLHNVPDSYIRFLRSQLQYFLQHSREGTHQQAWNGTSLQHVVELRRLAEILENCAVPFMDGLLHYKKRFEMKEQERDKIEENNMLFSERIGQAMAMEGWSQWDWGDIQVALCKERLEEDKMEAMKYMKASLSPASTVAESVFDDEDDDEYDDYDHIYSFEDPVVESTTSAAAQLNKLKQNAELGESVNRSRTPLPFTITAKSASTNWAQVAALQPCQVDQGTKMMDIDVHPTQTLTRPIPIPIPIPINFKPSCDTSHLLSSHPPTSSPFEEVDERDQSTAPNAKRQKLTQTSTTQKTGRRNSGLETPGDLLAQLRILGYNDLQAKNLGDVTLDYIAHEFNLEPSDTESEESDNNSTAPSTPARSETSPEPEPTYSALERRNAYLATLFHIRAEVRADMEAEKEDEEMEELMSTRESWADRSREQLLRSFISLRLHMWRDGVLSTNLKTNTAFASTRKYGKHTVEVKGALKEDLEDKYMEARGIVELGVSIAKERGGWRKQVRLNAMRTLVNLATFLPESLEDSDVKYEMKDAVKMALGVRERQNESLWAFVDMAAEEAQDRVEELLDYGGLEKVLRNVVGL